MLSTIRSYIPQSLMEVLLDQVVPPHEPLRRASRAVVLFADVSGFTPLTEALAQKGDEGPEEITRLLNRYFGRMIELLESEGGDVVKFSGDALTVVFPASDEPLSHVLRRAKQAADAMQALMVELAPVQTSAGPVELALKVGIGGGELLALQVGGVFRRWEYVICGEAVNQAAGAEGMASRGDVCLSPEMAPLLHPTALAPRSLAREDLEAREDRDEVELRLKRFLPGAVRSWVVDEELHNWLGVLRTMSVLFIGLSGIDYETEGSLSQLHTFLRRAQETIYRYQGSINKLAVDDKGTISLVLFGAPPFAHADDPLRAVRCALDLTSVAAEQGLVLRVGVTTARVFAGPVGSDLRREYTVMGDGVNMAARLMGKADAGGVLCDPDTFTHTSDSIVYEALPPTKLKGKAEPVPLYQPLSLKESSGEGEGEAMIGRRDERAALLKLCEEAAEGTSRTVLMEGEAGVGKSILLASLREQLSYSQRCISGAGQSLEQMSEYWAWREIFAAFFGLYDLTTDSEKRDQIRSLVAKWTPEDQERLPLLNDLFSLAFEENELSASLDASLRQQGLRSLLIQLLVNRSIEEPLCVLLDDLQWLDSLSWELALQLARSLPASGGKLCFIMGTRPIGPNALFVDQMDALKAIESLHTMRLKPLPFDEVVALVAARLGVSPTFLPATLSELIDKRSEGNPLFAIELLVYLRNNEVLSVEEVEGERRIALHKDLSVALARLPDSLEGLLLAHIDQLSPAHQLTLKVAAVIGSSFRYMPLLFALKEHTQIVEKSLQDQLEILNKEGFTDVMVERESDSFTYVFKHTAAQEVAYRTLLYEQRRQLHRTVATWYENTYQLSPPDAPGRFPELPPSMFSVLAFHWRRAGDEVRELHYVRGAARYSQEHWAHAEAITHLSRALELLQDASPEERAEFLLQREERHDNLGNRRAQQEDLDSLAAMCDALTTKQQLQVSLKRIEYAQALSSYDECVALSTEAVTLAASASETLYQAKIEQAWATALLSQGQIDEAAEHLQHSLTLIRAVGDKQAEGHTLRLLGNSHGMRGQLDEAIALFKASLALLEELDDYANVIPAKNNIGIVHKLRASYPEAIEVFSDAFAQAKKIGSLSLQSLVIGNLASTYLEAGEHSKGLSYLDQALGLASQIGSKSDECTTRLYLGEGSMRIGLYQDAAHHLTEALRLAQAIGHPYMEGYATLYLAELHMLKGASEDALRYADAAISIAADVGDPAIPANVLLIKGQIAREGASYAQALAQLNEAIEAFEKLGYGEQVCEAKAERAFSLMQLAQRDDALADAAFVVEALAQKGIQGMREPFKAYLLAAQVLQEAGRDEDVRQIIQEAKAYFTLRVQSLSSEEMKQAFHHINHHQALSSLLAQE